MKVCLAPSRVLCCPNMGGHAWVYANWTFGLIASGCEVVWLERCNPDTPPDEAVRLLHGLHSRLEEIGLNVSIALFYWPGQQSEFACVKQEISELTITLEDAADEADLLLNFYYALEPEVVARFSRTALVDIDPGLLQQWISRGDLNVSPHDVYFTIGETVGTPDARFPDCGLAWQYTPPLVHLPAWPINRGQPIKRGQESFAGNRPSGCSAQMTPDPFLSVSYTTVTSWWAEWEDFGGEVFSNEKRTSFRDFLDLPSRAGVPLELALTTRETEAENRERQELWNHGWSVVDPWQRCDTPRKYREYLQNSRGEFSCAKPSCMRLSNAWISDRTLCYLASGKPAVVQHTGPSLFLPDADGLFRFRNADEAVEAFRTIESDYQRQARQARLLAEEFFDAEKVVRCVLERAV